IEAYLEKISTLKDRIHLRENRAYDQQCILALKVLTEKREHTQEEKYMLKNAKARSKLNKELLQVRVLVNFFCDSFQSMNELLDVHSNLGSLFNNVRKICCLWMTLGS